MEGYTLVFESSLAAVRAGDLLFLLLPAAACLVIAAYCRTAPGKTLRRACRDLWVMVLIGTGLPLLFALDLVRQYQGTAAAYQSGDYLVVQGPVEDYRASEAPGKPWEQFTVDGVFFSYGVEDQHSFCYGKTTAQGGAIRRSGQVVRVGYVPWDGHNCIVRLECRDTPEPRAPTLPAPAAFQLTCLAVLLSLAHRLKGTGR